MRHITTEVGENGASLTAYIADSSNEMSTAAQRPAILIFPGGGYAFCSDREAEPIALAYLAQGFNAFVPRYTVGMGDEIFNKAFADAQAAIAAVRANAADWQVSERLGLIGFSAGGHLAASLATRGPDRPDALLLGYAVTLETTIGRGVPYPDTTPNVDASTPPTFLFHTRTDIVVPPRHALQFATALDQAGVPYELHVFADGPHGLSLSNPMVANGAARMVQPRFGEWLELSVSWLRTLWGDFATTSGRPTFDPADYADLPVSQRPIGALKADHDLWASVLEVLPGLAKMYDEHEALAGLSVERLAQFTPDAVPEGAVEQLEWLPQG